MDNINYANLIALVASVAAMIYLCLLIMPVIREMRRPPNSFSVLRRRLAIEYVLVTLLLSIRVPYFGSRIDVPSTGISQSIVTVATAIVLLYFAYNKYKSYTFKESKEK
jgi:hypothetical protein